MSGWEIAAPVLLAVLLLGLLLFSVLRPSSAVRFGIFVERKLFKDGDEEEPPVPPDEAPTREIRRKDDAW